MSEETYLWWSLFLRKGTMYGCATVLIKPFTKGQCSNCILGTVGSTKDTSYHLSFLKVYSLLLQTLWAVKEHRDHPASTCQGLGSQAWASTVCFVFIRTKYGFYLTAMLISRFCMFLVTSRLSPSYCPHSCLCNSESADPDTLLCRGSSCLDSHRQRLLQSGKGAILHDGTNDA